MDIKRMKESVLKMDEEDGLIGFKDVKPTSTINDVVVSLEKNGKLADYDIELENQNVTAAGVSSMDIVALIMKENEQLLHTSRYVNLSDKVTASLRLVGSDVRTVNTAAGRKSDRIWEPGGFPTKLDMWDWTEKNHRHGEVFEFDGCIRDTQLFDPGGITCVKDWGGFSAKQASWYLGVDRILSLLRVVPGRNLLDAITMAKDFRNVASIRRYSCFGFHHFDPGGILVIDLGFEMKKLSGVTGRVDVRKGQSFGVCTGNIEVFDPGGTYCVKTCKFVRRRFTISRQSLGMGLQQLRETLGMLAESSLRYLDKLLLGLGEIEGYGACQSHNLADRRLLLGVLVAAYALLLPKKKATTTATFEQVSVANLIKEKLYSLHFQEEANEEVVVDRKNHVSSFLSKLSFSFHKNKSLQNCSNSFDLKGYHSREGGKTSIGSGTSTDEMVTPVTTISRLYTAAYETEYTLAAVKFSMGFPQICPLENMDMLFHFVGFDNQLSACVGMIVKQSRPLLPVQDFSLVWAATKWFFHGKSATSSAAIWGSVFSYAFWNDSGTLIYG